MRSPDSTEETREFADEVRQLVAARVGAATSRLGNLYESAQLMPGKMLRTLLGARLLVVEPILGRRSTLARACAAIEMVHTASLCHDDVIDNGMVRRGHPALWQTTTASSAVLIGDILLCEAMELVLGTAGARYASDFTA